MFDRWPWEHREGQTDRLISWTSSIVYAFIPLMNQQLILIQDLTIFAIARETGECSEQCRVIYVGCSGSVDLVLLMIFNEILVGKKTKTKNKLLRNWDRAFHSLKSPMHFRNSLFLFFNSQQLLHCPFPPQKEPCPVSIRTKEWLKENGDKTCFFRQILIFYKLEEHTDHCSDGRHCEIN